MHRNLVPTRIHGHLIPRTVPHHPAVLVRDSTVRILQHQLVEKVHVLLVLEALVQIFPLLVLVGVVERNHQLLHQVALDEANALQLRQCRQNLLHSQLLLLVEIGLKMASN